MAGIWLGYQVNWIQQRRRFAARQAAVIETLPLPLRDVVLYRAAPVSQPLRVTVLNFLGEPPGQMVLVILFDQPVTGDLEKSSQAQLEYAAELFPESLIAWYSPQ